MASLTEIAFNIRNKITGGRSTHNEYISLDQIKFNIDYYRSLILHRDLEKAVLEDDSFYQKLEVEFEKHEENVYKSTIKLPKIVRFSHKYALRIGDYYRYPVTIHNSIRYMNFNKYTKNHHRAYLLDDHLFIYADVNPSNAHKIPVYGIFENPRQAYIVAGYDPEVVDDLPYPLSSDIIQRLSESIISNEVNLLQIPSDTKHDNLPANVSGS